jgi:hypothetical protein
MKHINTTLKKLLLSAAVFLSCTAVNAQLAMTRSIFNGALVPVVGGTLSSASGDDAFQQNIPVGFSFTYLGTPYTQFSVSTNGWMSFANGAIFDAFSPNLYSTTTNGVLAPWWDDLTTSAIVYQTTGAPGSQVCTIQWTSLSYYFTSTRTITYQVKLYEGTNVIEFIYGSTPTGTINNSESASIGIKSMTGGNGQYLDAVTGSAFTGNSSLQSDRWPTYNFRFSPGAPTALPAGTYTVGVAGTYRNLNEAAADVNHRGIAGAVTFSLIDAQYDVTVANGANFFPVLIGPVSGSSAANTLTFTKSATAAIIAYGGASGANGAIANQGSTTALASNVDPIIGLVGADYVTLNNLDIRGNVNNQVSDHGIGVYNSSAIDGATNNTITNVTVTMNRANTGSRGFVSNVITIPTAASGANSNNTFRDFTITSVYAGIQLTGNATFPDIGTQVNRTNCATFNVIGNPLTPNDIGNGTAATYGILATNLSGFTIANNSIRNVTNTGGQADGISIVTFQGTSTLNNNKIQGIRNSGTASTTATSGIRLSHTTTGSHILNVYNNAVSEITSGYTGAATTTRTLRGIFISGTGGSTSQIYNIFNNNVSLDGSGSLNLSNTCFEISTSSGPVINVANNVFANFTAAQGATAKHFNFVSTSATLTGNTGSLSNYNDLFIANDAGISGFVGLGNTTTYTTLANWQAAMVGMDINSVSLNPTFINNVSDLHATAFGLNGTAINIPTITTDLDCATRTPDNDIGAYIINACAGMPTAGSINGAATVCSGLGTTLTLSGASSGAGITYQWASSTTNNGPYNTILGTSSTQATGPLAVTTYYVVTTTCTVSGMSSTTAQFTVTVNPLPTVVVTPNTGSICLPNSIPIALTASGATTYAWGPATGLSATTGANVTANPSATTTYTVTGTNANGCVNTATATINVAESPSFGSVTATPSTICNGGSSQLLASASTTTSYTGSVISYTLIPTPGVGVTTLANAGVAVTPLSSGTLDDGGWQNLSIPFNFLFFGTSYNSFAISSNGFMVLGAGAPNTFTGYYNTWPSTFAGRPAIGPVYSDMDFRTTGTINYFVTGTAPNRRLVVNWTAGNFYSAAGSFTTQLVIFEGSNIIEAHTTSSTGTNTAVQGIQNAAGTTAFVAPGRNNVNWTVAVADGYRWAPSGGTPTYSWSPATFLNNTTINNPLASAVTASTTYTVTATNSGCTSTQTVSITAGTTLSATISASPSSTVCVGTNVTLNGAAVGGGAPYTYAWTGPNGFTSASQNPSIPSVTLAASGTYTLVISDGCAATATTTFGLTVNPLPTVAVTPTSGTICLPGGSPIALTASGASTYAWGPASGLSATTGANVTANPTATTTYTVSGTDANGCVNTATTAISVGAAITMDSVIATPAIVCNNGNSVLQAYASAAAPTYCQPVYGTGTQFGDYCSSVVVNTLNNPSGASASPYYTLYPASGNTTTTLVAGNTYTITLVAGTYTQNDLAAWIDYDKNGTLNNPGEKLGETDNLGAAPASTSFVFTVPLTAQNGTTRLRVREMDHAGTNDMDPCAAQSVYGETEDYTITITGGVDPLTYAWSPATFLSSTTTNPTNATAVTTATTYSVTATSTAGCTATGTVTLTTAPALTATATASPATTVCAGSTSTLQVSPAGGIGPYNYAWTGPNSFTSALQNPSIVNITTAASGTYTCVITDACASTSIVTLTLTINPLPVVALSGNTSICAGDSTLLTGSSGGTSQWYLNGVAIIGATSNTYMASAPGVYNMTKTNLNGCSDSAAVGITFVVNAIPTVTASASLTTVCSGSNVTFMGSGAASYAWSGGVTDNVPFAVTNGGYYTVMGTDANGCMDMDSVLIVVNTLPVVSLGADSAQCAGIITLDAGNIGSTYMWQDNSTAQTFVVTSTGTYYVTVTDANGCMSSDSVSIAINPIPVVALGNDSTQCGGSITLDAGNAGSTYVWSDNSANQTFTATNSGTYYVTVTSVDGCTNADTVSVIINTIPTVALGADIVQCGGSVSLDAGTSGNTYQWSNGDSTQVVVVSTSGTYDVTVSDSLTGCSSTDTVVVTINNNPVVSITAIQDTICESDASLTLIGAPLGGTFSGPGVLGTTFDPSTLNGLQVLTYTVTDSNNCTGSITDNIYVDACAGINEGTFAQMNVYPNPNLGQFTIDLGYAPTAPVQVEIMNALGQKVQSFTMTTSVEQVDLSTYEGGMYLVRITSGNEVSIVRVTKQ